PQGSHPTPVAANRHFAVLFNMMPNEERMQIPDWAPGPSDAKFNNFPPPGFMPAGYFAPPGPGAAIKRIGKRWVPPIEMWPTNPATFTNIFINGSYDGKFIFHDVSVTSAFLAAGTSLQSPFLLPALYAREGYYPTMYNVYKDDKQERHMVSLSHFVHRAAAQ
ncbi:MAG TPA: hypothetical protein VK907_10345, partial [Phnomibacter sp.]|nr:hypothetical protein [Phnomibacter sp.]